jgi:DNA primase
MISPVEEIKARLDIVEVIGSYIKLEKAGVNYRAPCPFHAEKKPSFFVSPARQIWHCFGGCSKGGDIFKFVMEIEGVEFADALRILAKKAGIELKKPSFQYKQWQTEKEKLFQVCESATRFFEKQLNQSKTGKQAKEYLVSRGIKPETIKKWRLGYAPDTWQGLSDFLSSKGYQLEEIKKAGLGLSSEKGSFYDRFRGRIIFPIFDFNSQVIGFGGRIFKNKDNQEIAKYVNTPQTLLYDKSSVLYGLDKAKVEIRKKDNCILVEGYLDLIMVSQAGFENVVATSGTALSSFQLKILKRYSDNLLTAFDMDLAGNLATKRGIDLAQHYDFNIKVVSLPENMDPADLILKDINQWQQRIDQAESIMDFYFNTAFKQFDKETAQGKRMIVDSVLPMIKKISNKIIQSHWLSELARRIKVKEEVIEQEMKKVKTESQFNSFQEDEKTIEPVIKTRRELIEERLAVLFLKFPEKRDILKKQDLTVFSKPVKEILINLDKKPGKSNSDFFNQLALKSEIEEIEEKDVLSEIEYCLEEINLIEINNQLTEISWEIKKAEEDKKWQKVEQLSKKFNELLKQKCQK